MSNAVWSDGMLALALFAVDPGTGGIVLRAPPGPVRDRCLGWLRALLPEAAPIRRMPAQITDDRLLGGLDLTATLRVGRPVASHGLLAEADGGVVLAAMAERLPVATAARLAAVLDSGESVADRDGLSLRQPTAIGIVALDEGIAEDDRPPAALIDRLAFPLDFDGIGLADASPPAHDRANIAAARALLPRVEVPDEMLAALATAADALGVAPLRALLLAVRATRAGAALAGRRVAADEDAMAAARLVLAPRATRLPAPPPEAGADAPPEGDPSDGNDPSPETAPDGEAEGSADQPLGELVLAAAQAAIPAGLLARLAATPNRLRTAAAGRSGAAQSGNRRGRPIGVRRGELGRGRLDLVATLRAAAPWQGLRRAAMPTRPAGTIVLPDDIRLTRFRQRRESVTIFVVDASGSAAIGRLAEAKGAVELVLAECYVRRDKVALIAFRGRAAELLLPPTGSLVRVRRSLAGLPGGGGTPLAAGIDAATALADAIRRRGQSPIVILLSDGRANVARDGSPGRPAAEADALTAARALRETGAACLVVDTAPRPAPQGSRLAAAMGGQYLPLPYADSRAVAQIIAAATHG